MELFPLIHDLALILGVASLFALIFQRIHQPLVLGYLLAGLIIGPYTPSTPMILDVPSIKIWAELGVIFLMFTLGLEFSFHKLTRVGVTSGFTACFEVFFMIFLGFGTGRTLGWTFKDSLFLGAMLSISSTTIIIKALDDLKLKRRRFAELIFGILIVEDLVAILILVGLSTFITDSYFSFSLLIISAGKLIFVIGTWFLGGYFIIPRIIRYAGKIGSDETIMMLSVALCLFLVVIASKYHYSAALGAFIMGSILAESSEVYRIENLVKPLKDLFASIFFVSVGMLLNPSVIIQHSGTILIIASVTIVGKVISTTLGTLITGQTLRTSIQVGFGLSQIGEFSFIIAGLGLTLGVTSEILYPIGVAVSLITTFTTPYMIRYSQPVAIFLENRLPQAVQTVLSKYVIWQQERKADAVIMNALYKKTLLWILNCILVTSIFILVDRFLSPILNQTFSHPFLVGLTAWCSSILISAPFIWAMSVAFIERSQLTQITSQQNLLPKDLTLLVSRLLTLAWIGILSLEFLPASYSLLLLFSIFSILFIYSIRHLETSYQWFESRFLSVFETTNKAKNKQSLQEDFAPWDSHLMRLKVHANSVFVLKQLSNTRFKEKYGLNIVAIQRGVRLIIAPSRNEIVLPNDELLALGTDEQIENIRPQIETPELLKNHAENFSEYQLSHFKLDSDSPLLGKTIRSSGIREEFETVIVGIEKNKKRIINPGSDVVLSSGDIIWVVGQNKHLEALGRKLKGLI